ncbi:nicotinamide riboside transporter PnuC [Zhongshania guokunii]|uniref:Nicotinamide riboside transporter PnuC n=1 Tax=Zhongshania guokunii TaxID=641783 RepID=A0ABV3U246_9GAMM
MLNEETLNAIGNAFIAMSMWELLAVVLALAYLLLAMKEKISCWYAAFISTAIYVFLFWDVSLLMESALQIFYLVMAVYGWWQWRKHGDKQQELQIHCWSLKTHCVVILAVCALSVGFGYGLHHNTNAALPYLDSFTTWGAVITTYMVTKKVLENWVYWLVIDAASVYLYIDRELYLTALLFVMYVVLVVIGFFQWYAIYQRQQRLN